MPTAAENKRIETDIAELDTEHTDKADNVISVDPEELRLREVFRLYDTDGSGAIDAKEFQSLVQSLGEKFTDEEAKEALTVIDSDSSGAVDFSEFVGWWTSESSTVPRLQAIKLKLQEAYFNEADKTPITRGEVFWALLGEILPLPSDYNVCEKNGPTYPVYINLNVLRVADLFAGIGMVIAVLIEVIAFNNSTISAGLGIVGNIFVFGGLNGKVKQVLRNPDWGLQRKLALRWFGPSFVPVGSTGRRAQMAIFACEGILCFSYVMNFLLVDLGGLEGDTPVFVLIGSRVFLALFFFTMAACGFCPVWSFTALFIKLKVLPRPGEQLSPVCCMNMAVNSHFYKMNPDKVNCCTHIRYGFYGPMMKTKGA